MKNNILMITAFLLVIGCSKDIKEDLRKPIKAGALSYTVRLTNDPNDLIYTQDYKFDEEGKVISEKFTNYKNPQYNHSSNFKYDSNGRVIEEIRNNEIFRKIIWRNDIAKVYDSQDELISEFQFSNSRLINYKLYQNNNPVQIKKLNYGANGNIISVEDENGIYAEYLNYDTSTINPLSLINSISILRIDYKPHFKHVFRTEKVHPYEGDDFSQPESFYEYEWTLNPGGLIAAMKDEKALIYTCVFEYN